MIVGECRLAFEGQLAIALGCHDAMASGHAVRRNLGASELLTSEHEMPSTLRSQPSAAIGLRDPLGRQDLTLP